MSNAALQTIDGAISTVSEWRSTKDIKARVQAIRQLMEDVLIEGVDYGKIPGLPKDAPPSLFKPGSEQILSMFQIAVDPIIEDLSTDDCFRFRVSARLTHAPSLLFLGAGVGECSSNETKYKWRKTWSEKEYEATPEDRRRKKFGRYKSDSGSWKEFEEMQIRQEPADMANTCLKMAKKRAQIDGTLTVTGASSMFQQDLEDLSQEVVETFADGTPVSDAPEPIKKTTAKPKETASASQNPPSNEGPKQEVKPVPTPGDTVTEPQLKMLFALQKQVDMPDDRLKQFLAPLGVTSRKNIPKALFQKVIDFVDPEFKFHQAQGGRKSEPVQQEEEPF